MSAPCITLYLPGVVRGDVVRRVDFVPDVDGCIRISSRMPAYSFEICWRFSLEKAFRDIIEGNQAWRIN